MGEGNIHLKQFGCFKFVCIIRIIVNAYAPFNVVPNHRYGWRWGKVEIYISKYHDFSDYWGRPTGIPPAPFPITNSHSCP